MNRNTLAALMGLALIAAPAANAEGLSYTYLEGRLVHTQLDVLETSAVTANGNGAGIAGSFAFGETGLFVAGSYDTVDTDEADISLDRTSLGLGYAMPLGETLHLVFDAKALRLKGTVEGVSESESGYQATLGARSMLADNVEGSIKAGVIKVENEDLTFYDGGIVELGARWNMDGMWSVGIDTSLTKDERSASIGLRAQW